MASEMLFMQLTLKGKPIKGDSTIMGYEGQIELTSMQWELAIDDKTAAKENAKTDINWKAEELKVSKYLDGASTSIYGHVDEREGLRTSGRSAISKSKTDNKAIVSMVRVSAREEGQKMPVLMRLTLAGCRIKSITTKASEGSSALKLSEDLRLAFQDIDIEYYPATDTEKRGAATRFSLQKKGE